MSLIIKLFLSANEQILRIRTILYPYHGLVGRFNGLDL